MLRGAPLALAAARPGRGRRTGGRRARGSRSHGPRRERQASGGASASARRATRGPRAGRGSAAPRGSGGRRPRRPRRPRAQLPPGARVPLPARPPARRRQPAARRPPASTPARAAASPPGPPPPAAGPAPQVSSRRRRGLVLSALTSPGARTTCRTEREVHGEAGAREARGREFPKGSREPGQEDPALDRNRSLISRGASYRSLPPAGLGFPLCQPSSHTCAYYVP
ncbi:unnamed protein product [Nyctereutes procyonoides]|uniref:(raccoon dog) hypothetical protein n=1 Tax=Nyctereutes procyonoides TaxID=34880 RepID=A0A811ZJ02_NYCPR|nr:unnamed protein product [Nyctereutes procyonoides]